MMPALLPLVTMIGASLLATAGISPSVEAEESRQATANERVVMPTGAARAVTVSDFRPREAESRTHNEVWTYVLLLDGGMQATFSITRANLGRIMGAVSGAEFSVTGFNGRTYRAPKEYPAENMHFDAAANRLEVHPDVFVEGALTGTHRIHFKTVKHDVHYEVDLSLTEIARGFTWGDGVFQLGSDRLGIFIHIPHARVRGSITIDGQTRSVSGTAYMDHTFQTDFAPKLVRSAFRYVNHGSTPEVGLFVMPNRRYEDRVIGFGGTRTGRDFALNRPDAVEVVSTRPALGVEVPRQIAFHFGGGTQTILNRRSDSQSFSVLEELTSIQRGVVRRFVGGEALVFRGAGATNQREPVAYDFMVIR